MHKLKELFIKYKEQILYLIFGGVTTFVSLACVWLFENIFNIIGIAGRIPADLIAITVAYITNKIWVFESRCKNVKELIKEIISFYSARLFTLILSAIMVYIFVDCLKFNNMLINLIASIVSIILNYIFSKLFVFKGKKCD